MADSKPIASSEPRPRTIKIARAYKTELDPTNKQKTLFHRAAGVARFTFNWALEQRTREYKLTGKSSRFFAQSVQLNAIKREQFPWMLEVSCYVIESALKDIDKAFKAFFRRCKNGEKPGYPKFKSKRNTAPRFRVREVKATASRVLIPKVGWIRLKEKGYIPCNANILSAAVSERAGRWFVSVQVEEEVAVPENQGAAVGIDLGLTSLVTLSDGRKIAPPKPLAKSMGRLRRLSRRHSRKCGGSANRRKSAAKLARLHYRIACQRSDFLNKMTTSIVCEHSTVGIESLNVRGMMRNCSLARGIGDAGWGELVRQLRYKSELHGATVIEANRFFPSTKTCSGCGTVKLEMPLSDRMYRCDGCGLELDRDVNAARNLLSLCTASSAGTETPVGDGAVAPSLKQEPSSTTCVGLGERLWNFLTDFSESE